MTERQEYLLRANKKLQTRMGVVYADKEMTSICSEKLPKMPRGSSVILSESVYKNLSAIQNDTRNNKIEYPFLLFGKVDGQMVYFDVCITDKSNISGMEAVFSDKMNNTLNDFIKKVPHNGTRIVAHGHSHPPIGNQYLRFSLGDMTSYMKMQDNRIFKSKEIEFCSVLLTGGNYNFLFYDGNDYYRFEDVFVQYNDGNFQRLQCYGSDTLYNNLYHQRGI